MAIGQHPACIASGLGFTEGPLWTSDGRLLVVGMSRGVVHEIDAITRRTRVVAEPGGSPSGLAEDALGNIWIAQRGQLSGSRGGQAVPGIQRQPGRVAAAIEESCPVENVVGRGFDAPNDLVIGPDGKLWFTDPSGDAFSGPSLPGRVWVYDPAGGDVHVVAEGLHYPNGLAFDANRNALYVAETSEARVMRFPLLGGTLGEPEVFIKLPSGRPDGIAFDRDDNLYVAATSADAVLVFDSSGEHIDGIAFDRGSMPTNVCFGSHEMRTLFVTIPKGGCVFAVERAIPGALLPAFSCALPL
jgi:gluconolactonase